MDNETLRALAIALLDDQYGISANAYERLRLLLLLDYSGGNDDIMLGVRSADGRFYLPEGWNK